MKLITGPQGTQRVTRVINDIYTGPTGYSEVESRSSRVTKEVNLEIQGRRVLMTSRYS